MSENFEELRAKEWLEGRGHVDICALSREGKDPPDFVIGDGIAVEVRRLTDASATKGKGSGIDKPLERVVGKVLEEAGEPPGGHDVYVSCGLLVDDLPPLKVTRRQVKHAVDRYINILSAAFSQGGGSPVTKGTRLEYGSFSYLFYSRPSSKAGRFKLEQATGAIGRSVVGESIEDINRCISKKTDKIEDKIDCYLEWWLVLVDCEFLTPLAWGPDTPGKNWEQDEWQQIRDGLIDMDPWSRVVVIGLVDDLMHVDLIERSARD